MFVRTSVLHDLLIALRTSLSVCQDLCATWFTGSFEDISVFVRTSVLHDLLVALRTSLSVCQDLCAT